MVEPMHDRPDTWPGTSRQHGNDGNGETQGHHVITGQVWHRSVAAPQAPAEPYAGRTVGPDGGSGTGGHTPHHGGGHSRTVRPPWVRPSRRRRIARLLAVLLCALLLAGAGTYAWADFRLHRVVDLGEIADRPPQGKGATYLIVGSDSRDGLSEQARQDLHTGSAGGGRTDSMMLLHTGAHGTTAKAKKLFSELRNDRPVSIEEKG